LFALGQTILFCSKQIVCLTFSRSFLPMTNPALATRLNTLAQLEKPNFLPNLHVSVAEKKSKSVLLSPTDLFIPAALPTSTQTQAIHAFVETAKQAPTLPEIQTGKIMDLGQTGESVKQIQKMLTQAGFGVKESGIFGPTTQGQVKAFQTCWKVSATGQIGPTTLKALTKAQTISSPLGQAIATSASAIANQRGTVGQCYNAAAEAIESNLPAFLWGMDAWMAADQLAKHPRFQEMPAPKDMNTLPIGAVVVWAKGSSPSGHISVYLGQGLEASDHIAQQMQSHYGGGKARIFLPR
jgi:hypothetical protein